MAKLRKSPRNRPHSYHPVIDMILELGKGEPLEMCLGIAFQKRCGKGSVASVGASRQPRV